MQVVILAGGLGTRLSEMTDARPKPMVDIGDRPMLRHVMEIYAQQGHADFVVALGYLGHVVKRYFHDWCTIGGDMDVDLGRGTLERGEQTRVPWRVRLLDTGLRSQTGGRVARLAPVLDDRFFLTYGDGVADVDLAALLDCHVRAGALATITAVRPPARFGAIEMDGARVTTFDEKPQVGEGWINGGFMVLEKRIVERIAGDETVLERDVLSALAREGKLAAWRHEGFWHPMDTLRDVRVLEGLYAGEQPPWLARR